MRFRALRLLATVIGASALASAAVAAPGYVVGGANLRAGPDVGYPLVEPLPPGTPAEIFGCLPGWSWCDIGVSGPGGDMRGWAAGSQLQLVYGGQQVLLPAYGAQLGLPLIGFDVDSYWGSYYRREPWFGDAGRWRHDDRGGPGFRGGQPGRDDRGFGRDAANHGPGPGAGPDRGGPGSWAHGPAGEPPRGSYGGGNRPGGPGGPPGGGHPEGHGEQRGGDGHGPRDAGGGPGPGGGPR